MVRLFRKFVERVLYLVPHRLSGDVARLDVDFLVEHVVGNLYWGKKLQQFSQ